MNNNHIFKWRKVILLSATFLVLALGTQSCKKKRTDIGNSLINQEDRLSSAGVDTFSLITYTELDDSIIARSTSGNPRQMLLGNYNDPKFGMVTTSIYTQLHLAQVNPPLDDGSIVIDSLVLSLEYEGFYGDVGEQTFAVYRLTEDLHADSTYYKSDELGHDGTNLIEVGSETQDLNPNAKIVVGEDTVYQLRIKLEITNLGNDLLNEAQSGSATFSSNEEFVNYFKGIVIKSISTPAVNDGGIAYFDVSDPDSKITMYYSDSTTESKEFEFKINTDCVRYNYHKVDIQMPTDYSNLLADSTLGQNEFYSQSFSSRAVIQIPGLDDIPKTAVIHEAILELPVQYQSSHKYSPSSLVRSASKVDPDSDELYDLLVYSNYTNETKSYSFNMRKYIQSIVKGDIPNRCIYISPSFFTSTADRIIFNGPNSINKAKPKLRIVYTEF